jgi:short-subunit dehydrogenase
VSFFDRYEPWAVVLGASEGLGEAYAHGIAERGLNVVVAARRAELCQKVAREVVARHGVETHAVTLDLATANFLDALRAVTDPLDVGLVVYNGAAGYTGPFKSQGVESLQQIVVVNCLGPALICEHFGPRMLARKRGGIVLMASAAGLAGPAYNAAYGASKAFDIVLGEALWAEWRDHGVDVLSVIGPAIDTPNFRAAAPNDGSMPPAIAPEEVVEEAFDTLGTTPSFVPGEAMRDMLTMLGTLPRKQQVEAMSAAHAGFADPS